jgi:CheY-like chemotaxis protein
MKKLIYIVDDEPDICDFSFRYLTKHFDDVIVKTFSSSGSAIEELALETPDLVITDYRRTEDPISTGLFLSLVKFNLYGKRPKVFLVSGSNCAKDKVGYLADAHLAKPLKLEDWRHTIYYLLNDYLLN